MKEPQLVRRIDRSTIVGEKTALLKKVLFDEHKTHFLYRVGGIAVGVVTGQSQFGEWTKLVGRFQAMSDDGNIYRSGTAFLPGDVVQILAEKLRDADQITFLYDVYARHDPSLATGYGYIVEPVRDPDEADPLDTLFSRAQALPAPDTKSLPAPDHDKKAKKA